MYLWNESTNKLQAELNLPQVIKCIRQVQLSTFLYRDSCAIPALLAAYTIRLCISMTIMWCDLLEKWLYIEFCSYENNAPPGDSIRLPMSNRLMTKATSQDTLIVTQRLYYAYQATISFICHDNIWDSCADYDLSTLVSCNSHLSECIPVNSFL